MSKFYSNENFRLPIVIALRNHGHDVLTTREAGNDNKKMGDLEVLEFSIREQRILLTFNRKHFIVLHREHPIHPGIVACTEDKDFEALAARIHQMVTELGDQIENQLVRIVRPNV